MFPKRILFLIFSIILVTACGGGGGGSTNEEGGATTPTPAPTPPPAPERYNIRGQVTLTGNVIIDSDVPNKAFSYLSNDISSNAQPIYAPSTVIGYSGRHTSEEGEVTQDTLDVYVLSLEGSSLQVTMNQAVSNADIDIFLYDSEDLNNPIEFSASIGQQESFNFTGSGIFYLAVRADQAKIGTKYSLSLVESLQSFQQTASKEVFDTGEFIFIKNKEKGSLISETEMSLIQNLFTSLGLLVY